MKIDVCAGGTGGHIFPACALLEQLENLGHDVRLITDERGDLFAKNITNKLVTKTVKLTFSKILILYRLCCFAFALIKLWIKNKPDIVVGFGGLFTIIPLIIAKIFACKIIIYEQNAVIGKANKMLSYISDKKISFLDVYDKTWAVSFPPVRKQFLKAKNVCCNFDGKLKIVIIGGSQGAISFASIIPTAISMLNNNLKSQIEIVQQVGAKEIGNLKKTYEELHVDAELLEFIENFYDKVTNASLIISRAGASTLSEIIFVNRPAILIPLPSSADNHQLKNAQYFADKQMVWYVEENQNVCCAIHRILNEVLENRELLKERISNIINVYGADFQDDLASMITQSDNIKKNEKE